MMRNRLLKPKVIVLVSPVILDQQFFLSLVPFLTFVAQIHELVGEDPGHVEEIDVVQGRGWW